MQLIVRKKYLDELIELYGTLDIKVITGIRRSGKSVLLQEFITYLKSLNEQINIVMINLQELEFDHVAKKRDTQIYIQVSDNISDEKTFEREYTPLLAIKDAYLKLIIARTRHETYDYQGIQVIDLCRWLREQ